MLQDKRILITGGTGSLGSVLLRRILTGEHGLPSRIVIFSRDEAKQHDLRVDYAHGVSSKNRTIRENFQRIVQCHIGDVRDPRAVGGVLPGIDIVINAAAMKQIPACEYFPYEAVRTNIEGAENIVGTIERHRLSVEAVVGISTDKACKPVNTMGMTKALQERIFTQANLRCSETRFVCVRYGNVLASRGSVIPLFHEQIRRGGPVTITTRDMTRFLLSLDHAVDTVFAAIASGRRGETYVPLVRSSRVVDIATVLIGDRDVRQVVTGIRPGEKTHEIMVSEDEATRTSARDRWYVIRPILPELARNEPLTASLTREYSSADNVMSLEETTAMLEEHNLLIEHADRTAPLLR